MQKILRKTSISYLLALGARALATFSVREEATGVESSDLFENAHEGGGGGGGDNFET